MSDTDFHSRKQRTVAAVDVGASGGRVVLGTYKHSILETEVVSRFSHDLRSVGGHLSWDIDGIWGNIKTGLRKANERSLVRGSGPIASIGVDTWGIDYVTLDSSGKRIGEAISYRDERTARAREQFAAIVSEEDQYRCTGTAQYDFNTLYQLFVDERAADPSVQIALLPDYISYLLTGNLVTEVTNAATTGLLDVSTRAWAAPLFVALGLRPEQFGTLVAPGDEIGAVRAELAAQLGLEERVPVLAVGSHDTASALKGTPATAMGSAYISAGTWSLIGVRVDQPVLTGHARQSGFTNLLDAELHVCFHRNELGAWLLNQAIPSLRQPGAAPRIQELQRRARAIPTDRFLFDVASPSLMASGDDMADRIREACRVGSGVQPHSDAELFRAIADSQAHRYVATLASAKELTGMLTLENVDVSGGGSQNELLWERVAELSGLRVTKGPVEATAIGNITCQLSALAARRAHTAR